MGRISFSNLGNMIGMNVHNRRVAKNWNQEKLAAESGLDLETVVGIEDYTCEEVKGGDLKALADALECAVEDLLGWHCRISGSQRYAAGLAMAKKLAQVVLLNGRR